jgi:hypothetical protein
VGSGWLTEPEQPAMRRTGTEALRREGKRATLTFKRPVRAGQLASPTPELRFATNRHGYSLA